MSAVNRLSSGQECWSSVRQCHQPSCHMKGLPEHQRQSDYDCPDESRSEACSRSTRRNRLPQLMHPRLPSQLSEGHFRGDKVFEGNRDGAEKLTDIASKGRAVKDKLSHFRVPNFVQCATAQPLRHCWPGQSGRFLWGWTHWGCLPICCKLPMGTGIFLRDSGAQNTAG